MTNPKLKMNVLLAKTDHLAKPFKEAVTDYTSFFKNKQDHFRGERKTYDPAAGQPDMPDQRKNKLVVTTVDEKLDWLTVGQREYIDCLFSQEATNAAGVAKAELIVAGQSWGEYSSLELLRLKSIIDNGNFEAMYANIPVRSDEEEWTRTANEMYKEREIYEGPRMENVARTTEKENYILPDPNLALLKEGAHYNPQVAVKTTMLVLGNMSHQRFSGEWSHKQRAELLRRRTILLNAVIEALKIANDVEAIASKMTAEKIFNYLHYGR